MAITERELTTGSRFTRLLLTDDERRLLTLLAIGLSTVEAAWQLADTPCHVQANRTRLYHKLGVTCDEDLVPFAGRHGLAI